MKNLRKIRAERRERRRQQLLQLAHELMSALVRDTAAFKSSPRRARGSLGGPAK